MERRGMNIMEKAEGILIYIGCPCGCERDLEVQIVPCEESEPRKDEVPEIGNAIWQQLVDDKGLEGAIEFLHHNA
jgi:hypothetical protein